MTEHGSDRGAQRPVAPAAAVERVTHQDVPAICSLYKKVWESDPSGVPSELVKSWQPTPLEFTSWMEGVTYFAARRDGRLIGIVGCELYHGAVRLVNLAVDPEFRRQAIATALVGAALDWARHSNASTVWVDALGRFTGAAALLKRLGFSESGVLHKHDFGEDVRFFERVL